MRRLDDKKSAQEDDTSTENLKGGQRFVENQQRKGGAEERQGLHERRCFPGLQEAQAHLLEQVAQTKAGDDVDGQHNDQRDSQRDQQNGRLKWKKRQNQP